MAFLHQTYGTFTYLGAKTSSFSVHDSILSGVEPPRKPVRFTTMTEEPLMPACVRGVINLRGAVVPVMDLQARFGQTPSPVTKRTCIVIVEVLGPEGQQVMGVVVDAVNEVLDIDASDIEPPPAFGTRIRTDFISGMGKVRGKFVILLNVNRVLDLDDLQAMSEALSVASDMA
nr:chemotaxis protein CheW [Comamonas kerstersii]